MHKNIFKEIEKTLIDLGYLIAAKDIVIQTTRKEFDGDFSLVCFGLTRFSGKNPEQTAQLIGEKLLENKTYFNRFNIVKGFLNISLTLDMWLTYFHEFNAQVEASHVDKKKVMIEYSSPNTNKPLHLGHVRNNLLGFSLGNILKAVGHQVTLVNLINDRGIHICKSMLAWQKLGNGETPESSGLKGDHLAGKYYVLFDKQYKTQIAELIEKGYSKEEAEKKAPWIIEAQEMLLKWEAGDKEIIELWKNMNDWVYDGFHKTYETMGVKFDKFYYESQTYLLGKDLIEDGLKKDVFFKKADGSVWIDLSSDGLDEKLVLRADGTSVYISQDIGTAVQRHHELQCDDYIYVVGNEQEYHFKVLKLILQKLGYAWSNGIFHLSYGMVDLPSGKMKSREGTVVDADDLMQVVVDEAKAKAEEIGKTDDTDDERLYQKIGMAALKYFILKVDPKKKMLFNPTESIDINGHTGPFIQYSYARICSMRRKLKTEPIELSVLKSKQLSEKKHLEMVKKILEYPNTLVVAAQNYSPSILANYLYELAKEFNQFYHDFPIIKEKDPSLAALRLSITEKTGEVILKGMNLLGIEMPEKM